VTSPCEGTVIESWKSTNMGCVVLGIINRGKLKIGDWILADRFMGRVRTISIGATAVKEAFPADPVVFTGLNGMPLPGMSFFITPTKDEADNCIEYRHLKLEYKRKEMAGILKYPEKSEQDEEMQIPKEEIKKTHKQSAQDSNRQPIILKTSNFGILETLLNECKELEKKEQINVNIVHYGVGDVSPTDLYHGQVEAEENGHHVPIYCFDVKLTSAAKAYLFKNQHLTEKLNIVEYNVIYHVLSDIKRLASLKKTAIKKH